MLIFVKCASQTNKERRQEAKHPPLGLEPAVGARGLDTSPAPASRGPRIARHTQDTFYDFRFCDS